MLIADSASHHRSRPLPKQRPKINATREAVRLIRKKYLKWIRCRGPLNCGALSTETQKAPMPTVDIISAAQRHRWASGIIVSSVFLIRSRHKNTNMKGSAKVTAIAMSVSSSGMMRLI